MRLVRLSAIALWNDKIKFCLLWVSLHCKFYWFQFIWFQLFHNSSIFWFHIVEQIINHDKNNFFAQIEISSRQIKSYTVEASEFLNQPPSILIPMSSCNILNLIIVPYWEKSTKYLKVFLLLMKMSNSVLLVLMLQSEYW